MNDLYIDAVCLFSTPFLIDPEEALRLRLLECLVPRLLAAPCLKDLSVRIQGLRFLTQRQLKSLFSTIEEVCHLLDIATSSIRLIHDLGDPIPSVPAITHCEMPSERIQVYPCDSDFETELLDIFIPLLNYGSYYCLYGVPLKESVLLCGHNSGKRFVRWFRDLQSRVTKNASFGVTKKLELHLIRIEDVLSPYFGESEQRLVHMFETAISTMDKGITCICLEGIHHFEKNKENLEDLDRRLLTTTLLLLDSITKGDLIVQHSLSLHNNNTDRVRGSLVVVSTSESHPDKLSDALTRPGRLNKIIFAT